MTQTPEQKRVAIAKDVIAHINSLKVAESSSYFWRSGSPENVKTVSQARKKCKVCAIGALFLSAVDKYNQINLQQAIELDQPNEIKKWFSEIQLGLIELAFERKSVGRFQGKIILQKNRTQAIGFGMAFSDPKDRLLAIAQNIVDHKGEFKPEVEYEIVGQ